MASVGCHSDQVKRTVNRQLPILPFGVAGLILLELMVVQKAVRKN